MDAFQGWRPRNWPIGDEAVWLKATPSFIRGFQAMITILEPRSTVEISRKPPRSRKCRNRELQWESY